MPIDKNKLHRYRILNELLSDRSRYYTIKDLEKLCSQRLVEDGFDGVSVRTIRYDLHDIETEYGIDISHIKINGKSLIMIANINNKNMIVVNPSLYYKGNNMEALRGIINLFKIADKK